MIDINSFIVNFSKQFEGVLGEYITPETRFWDLEEWSSLIVLKVLGMIDIEYDVDIDADEIRTITTIQELYDLVQSRA